MRWFANRNIHVKLLLSFLPLVLIVIGALLFASAEMEHIKARYNALLANKVKAITALARTNQRAISPIVSPWRIGISPAPTKLSQPLRSARPSTGRPAGFGRSSTHTALPRAAQSSST